MADNFPSNAYGWTGDGYTGIGQSEIDNACSGAIETDRLCINDSAINDTWSSLTLYANLIGIEYNLNPKLILSMITLETDGQSSCQGVNVISAPALKPYGACCPTTCCTSCEDAQNTAYQNNPLAAIDSGVHYLFDKIYSGEGFTNILSAISGYNGAICGMTNGEVTTYGASAAYYADLCSSSDNDLPLGFVGFAGGGLH